MITRSLSRRRNTHTLNDAFAFSYTVDPHWSEGLGAIPFNLYGIEDDSLTLKVDWGDGNKSTFSPEDFPTLEIDLSNGLPEYFHQYSGYYGRTFTITVSCSDWSQVYFQTYSNSEIFDEDFPSNLNIKILRDGVISIDSPIPPVAGKTLIMAPYGQTTPQVTKSDDYISNVFNFYYQLSSIPNNLFINLPNIFSISNIFKGCSNLTNIPSGLFNGISSLVYDAYGAFQGCSNLLSIPNSLLNPLIGLEEIDYMFSETGITSIPEDLFTENSSVYSISGIFYGCSALVSIPENLFINNTALQYAWGVLSETSIANFTLDLSNSPLIEDVDEFCDADSSGSTTRIIKVPADSTTYTSFSGIASDLNLTIQTV